jgi:hypothetical protein
MAANAFTLNFRAVSPWLEMGAYEALWDSGTASFKSLAAQFGSHPGSLPSDFIPDKAICERYAAETVATLRKNGVDRFGIRLNGAGDYPPELRDAEAKHRVEMLYFRGFWNLVEPAVSPWSVRENHLLRVLRTRIRFLLVFPRMGSQLFLALRMGSIQSLTEPQLSEVRPQSP